MIYIIIGYFIVFTLGFFAGREIEERSNVKQIQRVLDESMEEENRRIIQERNKQSIQQHANV